MKRVKKFCYRHTSFTLVELLVVISIIAILASVTIAGASSAIRAAQRAKMKVTATGIQTGVQNFFTDYGSYPIATNGADVAVSSATDWGPIMIALCGAVNPNTGAAVSNTVNTRSIPYISISRSDLDSTVPSTPVLKTLLKPTGVTTNQYYSMMLDGNYDNLVMVPDFSGATAAPSPGVPLTSGVAVWSNADQVSTGGKSSSWVYTW